MVIFDSYPIYKNSRQFALEMIKSIDMIIAQLVVAQANASTTANTLQYSFDTGQTKGTVMYRSPNELAEAITKMFAIKEHYVNEINGRSMHLVDGKNFRGPMGGFGYR